MTYTWTNRTPKKRLPKRQYGMARQSTIRARNKFSFELGSWFPQLDATFASQLLGLSILSIALLMGFQNFSTGIATQVEAEEFESEVRLLTNFEGSEKRDESGVIYSFEQISSPQSVPSNEQSVPQVEESQYYTVKSGDSLSSIANLLGVDAQVIITKNNLQDPRKLAIGQQLYF